MVMRSPSEHYAEADKMLAGLDQIDKELGEKFDTTVADAQFVEWLTQVRKYTVEKAAVHAALAGVPPVVYTMAWSKAKEAREAELREQLARDKEAEKLAQFFKKES